MKVLEVHNLGINFGGLRAVDNFNLTIEDDELVGIIGPNGAGKTTIFNLLTGVYKASDGEVLVNGRSTKNKSSHQIINMGLARTFQNIRLFNDMTVIDNVKVGLYHRFRYSLFTGLSKTPKFFHEEEAISNEALKLMDVFGLTPYQDYLAANLPYGKQRELEIIRALATKPSLLLLDEPAAGMNPQETIDLMNTIRKVKDEFATAILLIEHDMRLVKGICQRVVVLNYGQVLTSGPTEEVLADPEVIKAYLGE